jgi:hypothetical protein
MSTHCCYLSRLKQRLSAIASGCQKTLLFVESSHLLDTGGLTRIIPDIPVYNCRYTGGKTEEMDKIPHTRRALGGP